MTPPRIVTPERAKEIEQRLANSHGAKWYMDENGSWSADGYGFIADVDFMSEADEALALNCPEDLRDLLHTLAVEREENARRAPLPDREALAAWLEVRGADCAKSLHYADALLAFLKGDNSTTSQKGSGDE